MWVCTYCMWSTTWLCVHMRLCITVYRCCVCLCVTVCLLTVPNASTQECRWGWVLGENLNFRGVYWCLVSAVTLKWPHIGSLFMETTVRYFLEPWGNHNYEEKHIDSHERANKGTLFCGIHGTDTAYITVSQKHVFSVRCFIYFSFLNSLNTVNYSMLGVSLGVDRARLYHPFCGWFQVQRQVLLPAVAG